MGENSVSKRHMGKPGKHRRLHDSHDLAGFRANHGKADYTVVGIDKRLHEPFGFRCRARPQYRLRRQLGDTHRHALGTRLFLAYSDPCKRRVDEHAIGRHPVFGRPVAALQIVADGAEIVERHMGELRRSRALADCPDVRGGRLQPIVDADIAAIRQLDACLFQPSLVYWAYGRPRPGYRCPQPSVDRQEC